MSLLRRLSCTLTITLLAVFSSPSAAACPSPAWTQAYNGFCYLLVNNTWPWYVAETSCDQVAAPGARLVSVHDVQLNAFLAETVAGGGSAWLGARRATTYAEWAWTDGTPFDFSYWYAGEPSGGGELCAVANCGRVGEWCARSCHDFDCVFICEIEDGGAPTTPPPPTPTGSTAGP